ncbi:MAG: cadherin-like beta sandwich domain-containing protein [Clostridia bacterium]|nr:cadherin-like beta sandwich domain-containing protein [Clostridia bacterium]
MTITKRRTIIILLIAILLVLTQSRSNAVTTKIWKKIATNDSDFQQIEKGQSIEQQEHPIETNSTNLKILRINQVGMTPTFSPEVKEYYFVTDIVTDLEITAVSEDDNAQVVIEGNQNLQMGKNIITITVTSKDNSQQSEYQIHVTRTNNTALANTNLETLAISQGTLVPEFDNLITEYETEVENNVKSINILAIPESMNAKVTIQGNQKLAVGDNLIVVTVLAEDNLTEKQYRVRVHRRNDEEQQLSEQEQASNAKRAAAIIEEKSNSIHHVIEPENRSRIAFLIIAIIGVTMILIAIFLRRKRKN